MSAPVTCKYIHITLPIIINREINEKFRESAITSIHLQADHTPCRTPPQTPKPGSRRAGSPYRRYAIITTLSVCDADPENVPSQLLSIAAAQYQIIWHDDWRVREQLSQ